MQTEAGQYSYNILKNRLILSLNILINNILIKKECTTFPAKYKGCVLVGQLFLENSDKSRL